MRGKRQCALRANAIASVQPDLRKALRPIYEELTEDDLLERCVGAFSQNNNEYYHSVIWRLAPKLRICGKRTIESAVHIAACTFNEGQRTLSVIMKELCCIVGENCYKQLEASYDQRLERADRRSSSRSSHCEERASLQLSSQNLYDTTDEDDISYGPGIDSSW